MEISRRGLLGLMQAILGVSAWPPGIKTGGGKESTADLWACCWLHDEGVPSVAVYEDHAVCFGCKTVFRDRADVERFRMSAWMRAETVRADKQLGDILEGRQSWSSDSERRWSIYQRS